MNIQSMKRITILRLILVACIVLGLVGPIESGAWHDYPKVVALMNTISIAAILGGIGFLLLYSYVVLYRPPVDDEIDKLINDDSVDLTPHEEPAIWEYHQLATRERNKLTTYLAKLQAGDHKGLAEVMEKHLKDINDYLQMLEDSLKSLDKLGVSCASKSTK